MWIWIYIYTFYKWNSVDFPGKTWNTDLHVRRGNLYSKTGAFTVLFFLW